MITKIKEGNPKGVCNLTIKKEINYSDNKEQKKEKQMDLYQW